jgi:hypothetical protein
MGNGQSKDSRRIDAHSLQQALQKALVLMTSMACKGYFEKTWLLRTYCYVKPVKILRLERQYSMQTTDSYDKDSQIKDVMQREMESLETWSNWFKSLLRSSIRDIWNAVLKGLRKELRVVCDVDISDVFLPLWSTLRRLSVLADLFDLNTDDEHVQAEIIFCLVQNSVEIRQHGLEQLNPSAAGQMVGECLVLKLKEDREDGCGDVKSAEEGLTVNMEKLKLKLSSEKFKNKAHF